MTNKKDLFTMSSKRHTNRTKQIRPKKRLDPVKKKQIVPNSGASLRNKTGYQTAAKKRFNEIFATEAAKLINDRSPKRHILYLDGENLGTTNALVDHGINVQWLQSVNEETKVVNLLKKENVHSENGSFEPFLCKSPNTYAAIYYDGCGAVVGKLSSADIWIGNILKECLMKFSDNVRDESILAFTVSLRCGPGYPKYSYNQAYSDFRKQTRIIIQNHGFAFEVIHSERYPSTDKGENMWFICFRLRKLLVANEPADYVDNPVYKDEFLGFRPGTVL